MLCRASARARTGRVWWRDLGATRLAGLYVKVTIFVCVSQSSAGILYPTFPISDCGCPKNPPSFTTVMVEASTNAVNYPIGLTKPSLGAVN